MDAYEQLSLFAEDVGISEAEIGKVLQAGSGFEGGKSRIVEKLTHCGILKENADFLKEEYGIGGRHPVYLASKEEELTVNYDSQGLEILRISNPKERRLLSWSEVASRIKLMIRDNTY